jgi:hypothetical protein
LSSLSNKNGRGPPRSSRKRAIYQANTLPFIDDYAYYITTSPAIATISAVLFKKFSISGKKNSKPHCTPSYGENPENFFAKIP